MRIYKVTQNNEIVKKGGMLMKYKRYKLSDWCKTAQIALITSGISIQELTERTGYSRQHVSSILNGRTISDRAISKISDVLGISNEH